MREKEKDKWYSNQQGKQQQQNYKYQHILSIIIVNENNLYSPIK
jgi:hypothetical protein